MTAKKPLIQKTLPKPVYSQEMKPFDGVFMHLYLNRKDWNSAYAFYKRRPFEDVAKDSLGTVGWAPNKSGMHYIVGVFDGRRTTLVHELSHLIILVLDHFKLHIPDSYGEAFCYHLDSIFAACAPLFRKN